MATTRRGRGSTAGQRQRQRAIQEFVSEAGSRTVEEIARFASVSTMTVYRDLGELERLGLLRRVKGVVTAAASNLQEASSRHRVGQDVDVKQRLGEAALEFVETGSAIMLDDSSTGLPLARLLSRRTPLTVITNYQPVARELEENPGIRLLMTGGEYLAWADALFGPMAVRAIRRMRADAVFMSASAITDGAAYHPTEEAAEVKRAMLASSSLRVLYVDHSKFDRRALHRVAPLTDYDVLILDRDTPEDRLASLPDGIRVIRV